ncbi:MAG: hypothetical protein ACLQMO_14760 [Acidobacteriaceae bacterium]
MQTQSTLNTSAVVLPHFLETENLSRARLDFSCASFSQHYDREPFSLLHNLHTLDLFQTSSLGRLCDTFSASNRGYFIASGAPSGGAEFYSVPHGGMKPDRAIEQLDTRPLRILLKRPENQDARFLELLNVLFRQVAAMREELTPEHVLRLESAVLITSGSTITPIHFDPVIGFFAQIEGEKTYHVYSSCDTTEKELERFYIRGVFDIGLAKLEHRDPAREHVFRLGPGIGLHQPQNACHWVETGAGRSVSYTFVFQTEATHALGRTRAFNHYQRKLGIRPAEPGIHPWCDAVKADTMRVVIPLRQRVGQALEKVRKDSPSTSL